ncbi:hypothetical protein KR51_00015770 [Rubidibacter lacunae KORDI 51-2]|uniref:Ribbon-helix-helix protein, copG family n=1 Tax=Rubidibacter lacunae KORDI 51-2 TaxID=582515 RepID=U5DJ68_9CHRO|nr:hypothetical protein [Rubidibacter lacunae]ERN41731.1 hypothetical protein KR51_00015770 [Rubidibacter lacunae KORDI 51-2]
MKTKISATVDAELLSSLEKQTGEGRSQLLEKALRHYQRFLTQQQLEQFYSQHPETADEQYAADVAEMNAAAALADD